MAVCGGAVLSFGLPILCLLCVQVQVIVCTGLQYTVQGLGYRV